MIAGGGGGGGEGVTVVGLVGTVGGADAPPAALPPRVVPMRPAVLPPGVTPMRPAGLTTGVFATRPPTVAPEVAGVAAVASSIPKAAVMPLPGARTVELYDLTRSGAA